MTTAAPTAAAVRPELSIVIVSYNARRDLEACLDSLADHPPQAVHEVVVVDNASTDGSADAAAARAPRVRLLRQARNAGFSAANNAGIRQTSGELILLLNSDTIVPAGAIDALIGRLRAVPSAAAAGPRLVDPSGKVELSFGPMISPLAEARQKAVMALHDRGFPPASWWVARATSRERFFLYTEDVDFCAALRSRGRRILFAPAVRITHLRGRSRAGAPGRMNAAYRRSQIAFYEKHHPRWVPALKLYLRMKGQAEDPESGATR